MDDATMRTLLWLCPEVASAEPAAVRGRYARLREIARSAVAGGFAGFAASEHHWRTDGYCPDAMGLLTGIGAVVRPPNVYRNSVGSRGCGVFSSRWSTADLHQCLETKS